MAQDPGLPVTPVTKDGREGVQIVGSNTAQAISKDVAAVATPEPLGTGAFNGVVIAKSTNTATLYLGDATNQFAPMNPGDERELVTGDLSQWYCKVGVNGEGVYLVGG